MPPRVAHGRWVTEATDEPEPWRRAAREAFSLLLPVWCAGCGAPDEALCGACRALLGTPPIARVLAGGLEVRSAAPFTGAVARALRAFKEDSRPALARPLGRALAAAAAALARDVGSADVAVAVPSSREAVRRRGYRTAPLLAARAGLRPVRMLRVARATLDQRTLGRAERSQNLAGSLEAAGRIPSGIRVLLIDDVVTTGASLCEARRALECAGASVVGAATVASTPRRHDTADTVRIRA